MLIKEQKGLLDNYKDMENKDMPMKEVLALKKKPLQIHFEAMVKSKNSIINKYKTEKNLYQSKMQQAQNITTVMANKARKDRVELKELQDKVDKVNFTRIMIEMLAFVGLLFVGALIYHTVDFLMTGTTDIIYIDLIYGMIMMIVGYIISYFNIKVLLK